MKQLITILLLFISIYVVAQKKSWTLSDCIQYALENDLTIRETSLQTEIATKQITAAYGNLLPNANLYADHQYNFGSVIDPTTNARISSDIRSNSLSFSSNVELFNWGNFIRIQTAKLQNQKSLYDTEIKKNELTLRIVQIFSQLQFDKEQIELIQNQLKNTQANETRIKREVELGNKAKSDWYEIQANLTSEEQMLVSAQNAYRTSYTSLLGILNLTEEIEVETSPFSEPQVLKNSLEESYKEGLQNRPEIKASDVQKEISQKNIRLQKSNYLPRITGNYSLSSFYVDTETSSLGDQFKNNKNHYLGISLNIPIFNKLQVRTAVQQAKIEAEQANLQAEQQKQIYHNALRDAYTKTENAYLSWKANEKNLTSQELAFSKTEEKFKQGLIDSYGYFAAKNNLLNAQTQLLQSKYTYFYESLLFNWYVTNQIATE